MSPLLALAESGLLPDTVIRLGIRRLLRRRLQQEAARPGGVEHLVEALRASPVALVPEAANRQHYEVPASFFATVLGPWLKYSCCLWEDGVTDLAQAEEAMLALTAARARLQDGQDVLDLGCGWGSFTLWAAARYPRSRFLAVSNSSTQRAFICARAAARGLGNVRVETADANRFEPRAGAFDRVVSVEMFEHVRNYPVLLRRLAAALRPDGELFVHIFCHRTLAYPFEQGDRFDWMARHFFSGGLMPSFDLLGRFQDDLALAERWVVNGRHYARTLEAWLARLDAHRPAVQAALAETYGAAHVKRWVQRWRMFFMACAECFAYGGGEEWHVGHYRFTKPPSRLASRRAPKVQGERGGTAFARRRTG